MTIAPVIPNDCAARVLAKDRAFRSKPTGTYGCPSGPASKVNEGKGPEQFQIVHGIAVSHDGNVYVSDRTYGRVQVFTIDGKYVTQVFIPSSSARGQAGAVAFSPDQEQKFMYVASSSQIVVVDRKALQPLYSFGSRGTKPGEFPGSPDPHHLTTDAKGNIYTVGVGTQPRAQKFAFKGLAEKR